ncbi:hypothetical protein ONS96_003759 [Cadophora gregata f. sp. sojae]|nr:hypothetical protein ONS96_003759 [Cadophora gregata f. sp. sojae]
MGFVCTVCTNMCLLQDELVELTRSIFVLSIEVVPDRVTLHRRRRRLRQTLPSKTLLLKIDTVHRHACASPHKGRHRYSHHGSSITTYSCYFQARPRLRLASPRLPHNKSPHFSSTEDPAKVNTALRRQQQQQHEQGQASRRMARRKG